MTDSVMAESSLFWKLVIEPTQFPWFFCEPVARIFESESESEPYSRDGYLWRCCFKETMINGRVTIDINVVRVHIKGSAQWQDVLRRTSNKEDILPFGSTAQQVPIKSTQHPENLQHQRSSVGDANQRDQEWPPKIHYKTVAFYTPQKNAPITSIFLNGDTIAVQLDAETILHRGKYQLEFVFSEETSSNRTSGLSSCHRILDSLFHEVVATSLPNPQAANIWFEFPLQASNGSQADISTHLSPAPSSRHVPTVAAHEEVLRQYPKFAEWIDQERANQEQARRCQLQEEWKIHLEGGGRPSAYPTLTLLPPSEQCSGLGCELSESEGHNHDPRRRRRRRSVAGRDHQGSEFREQPVSQRHHVMQQQQQQQQQQRRQQPSEGVESQARSESSLHLHHSHQQPPGKQEYRRQQQLDHSPSGETVLPALRIVVTDITLGTFQALLQFLYTGQIGISEEQEYEIDLYWNDNPEDLPIMSSDQRSKEGFKPTTLPDPLVLLTHHPGPSFVKRLITPQEVYPGQGNNISDERMAFHSRFPNTPANSAPIYMVSSSSALSSGLPCSRRNRRLSSRAGSASHGISHNSSSDNTAGNDDHTSSEDGGSNIHRSSSSTSSNRGGIVGTPRYRPCCSWENLLAVAWRFQLKELQALSMKATKCHCQMMAIRSSINSNAHYGSDEDKLDLQLAWCEQVLCSFLRLYNSPRVRVSEQGLTIDRGEEEVNKSSTQEAEETKDTFSQEVCESVEETSASDAVAAVTDGPRQQSGSLVESKDMKPFEEENIDVLMEERYVEPSIIHQSLETSDQQPQQRFQSSSSRAAEPLGVARVQVSYQLSQKTAHSDARDEPCSADCNSTDRNHHMPTGHCEPHQSLFENPVCEQAILELCQHVRSRYLRMRDILE